MDICPPLLFVALVGRAAVARVLKGFTREGCRRLRSTLAGLTVLNPCPPFEKKGLPGGDVDAPSGLAQSRTG